MCRLKCLLYQICDYKFTKHQILSSFSIIHQRKNNKNIVLHFLNVKHVKNYFNSEDIDEIRLLNLFLSSLNFYPADIFLAENFVYLLHLRHIFKFTPEYFYHGIKQYEP